MPRGKEWMQKELVKDLEHHARHFCVNADQLNKDLLVEIDIETRTRLGATLQTVVDHSKEILRALNVSCPYCRRAGGEALGKCVQCDRSVCDLCGQKVDGEAVHISVCSLWYGKNKKGEE